MGGDMLGAGEMLMIVMTAGTGGWPSCTARGAPSTCPTTSGGWSQGSTFLSILTYPVTEDMVTVTYKLFPVLILKPSLPAAATYYLFLNLHFYFISKDLW